MATRLKTVRYWQHELKHNKTTFIIYSVLRFLVLVILVIHIVLLFFIFQAV